MGAKADFWKGHLDGWRCSGLTQTAYCRRQGLRLPSFGYWRRTLHKAAVPSALVPIVAGEVSTRDMAIEVQLPNGLLARLPVGMDPLRWVPMMQALRAC